MKLNYILLTILLSAALISCDTNGGSSNGPRPTSGTETIDFYAINDFHGAIEYNESYGEPGLAKVGGYLKTQRDAAPDNTVILSSGDMWQGTYESYYNHGKVITESMNNIGFVSMSVGNHEFDWGSQDITYNAEFADFPMLGANIMNYPDITTKSDITESYVIVNRGHLKIGVIGAIGQDQITSINSFYTKDVYFADPTPIIKDLSTKLRNDEKCDMVVLSIHTGKDSVDRSLATGGYVDAVFCAHTHQVESEKVSGVPFIQGGTKGERISHVKLSYDYATKEVTCDTYTNIAKYKIMEQNPDQEIRTIINSYSAASSAAGDVNVGTFTYDADRYSTLPNMSTYTIAQESIKQGHNITLAMTNYARESIYAGTITYKDLFKGLPFDNYIYIVRAMGSDIIRELGYGNFIYRVDETTINENEYYTIAVIDYLLWHQNVNKIYDYFPHFNPDTDVIGRLEDSSGNPLLPRDLIAELVANAPNNQIDPRDYSGASYTY
ncbi:MAG: 5'-nucleotidase C-terminal domain-containing protein [Erysipelotrichaceae bacterium]|jgi:2',3'-cyclic-nucleotide 2'-phosphodiesterase (5'-nucleotidase family)|nr:5'-nucleotidase C-terminal domain-containing protein [Erysipelotrichaceae bacterium]